MEDLVFNFNEVTQENYQDFLAILRTNHNWQTLFNTACSSYRWKGLSEDKIENETMSMNLERSLMTAGYSSIKTEGGREFFLPMSPAGVPDLDYVPIAGIMYGPNGKNYNTELNAPILTNTISGWSVIPLIRDYAKRLERIDCTVSMYVNALKVPYVVTTPTHDEEGFIALKIKQAIDNDVPIIITDDDAFLKKISVMNTGISSATLNDLTALRQETLNQFYAEIGRGSMLGEKKERLLVDEISRGAESINSMSNSLEIARERNAKLLSEYFGREVTFEKVGESQKATAVDFGKGGDNDVPSNGEESVEQ